MSFLIPIAFPVVFTLGKILFLFLPQFVGRRVRIAPVVPFALRLRAPLAAFMQQGIGTAAPVLSSGFAACGARLRSRPRRGSCGLRFFVNALSKNSG